VQKKISTCQLSFRNRGKMPLG